MRIEEFIKERDTLICAIKELCSLRDHVFNARRHMLIDARPVMVTGWYSPSEKVHALICDEITDKIKQAEAKLAKLEARVSIN